MSGFNEWLHGWNKNNYVTRDFQPVKNTDLWKEIHQLKEKAKELFKTNRCNMIMVLKVKGHSNDIGNNMADDLAKNGTRSAIKEKKNTRTEYAIPVN